MQRICLFKNKHDKNIIDHRNYNFFAQSIVNDTLELLYSNKILQITDMWDLIDFFQLNYKTFNYLQQKIQLNIKYAFIILSNAIVKVFSCLEILSNREILNLIFLGKDIALTSPDIPDIIDFVKNKKSIIHIILNNFK